eukprot:1852377-Prymnesium_polylepis.2
MSAWRAAPREHHTWHADATGTQTGCRTIAALFYLNDVKEVCSPTPDSDVAHPSQRRGQALLPAS